MKAALVASGEAAVAAYRESWPRPRPGQPPLVGGLVEVAFGGAGNDGTLTRYGWSLPEDGFTWSAGRRAGLLLPKPQTADRFRIELELAPFIAADLLPQQRLLVIVNGVRAPAITLPEIGIVSFELDGAIVATRPALGIALEFPDAARPCDVTGVDDDRLLAFSLRRLRVEPIWPTTDDPSPPPEPANLPVDTLLLGFESLGENCEFGLVQRSAGIEPLGLLRFASAPLPVLLTALGQRFAGMADAEMISVELSESGREYLIQDRAFGFVYHAWIEAGTMSAEAVHQREARRAPFLVRKLLEDLASGDKIFVYHAMQPMPSPAAPRLAAAIAAHGPGTLLWVELADADNPPGSVRRAGQNLLIGRLARFAPADNAEDFDRDGWIALCRLALALV